MTKKSNTLHEKEGVSQPETTHKLSAEKIKINRSKQNSVAEFVTKILEGNISFLSRAITLVESTNSRHQQKANEILEGCLPHANNSVRIGITGVPGVGKSTFIESFGKQLTSQGKKVAVLAIDPSSSIYKGYIRRQNKDGRIGNGQECIYQTFSFGNFIGRGCSKNKREYYSL